MVLDCPRTHLRCALWLLAAVAATHDDHALRCLRLTDAGAASWSRNRNAAVCVPRKLLQPSQLCTRSRVGCKIARCCDARLLRPL